MPAAEVARVVMAAVRLAHAWPPIGVVALRPVCPLVIARGGARDRLEAPEGRVVVRRELLRRARLVDVTEVEEAVEPLGSDPPSEQVVVLLGHGAVADRPHGERGGCASRDSEREAEKERGEREPR
jgi:hypothetical protein